MAKLTKAQIEECEKTFGQRPGIKQLFADFGYDGMNHGQKEVFWNVLGKPHLVENRIPLPSFLAIEEPVKEIVLKDIREDLAAVKKEWAGVRVYAATDETETGPGSVMGLSKESGGKMYLRATNSWHFVEYVGKNSVGRVDLAPSVTLPRQLKLGIHSGPFGGCSGVAVLYGNREAGLGKPFAVASFAHLAGSDPASINWKDLYPSSGWQPGRHVDGAKVCAVVFADSGHAAGAAIKALNTNLRVQASEITVYLARALTYCGVDHMGRFGHTRR